ncbi:GGDEF domain-containing protein [Candidatus Woesearchaeota archaeon]|nr:GGDEF domain-containing protein [Candidatus Woesearchaeota archaeon]
MDKRLEEIIRDPDGFLNKSKNSDKLAVVTKVAREANLDDIKLSCGAFLSILGESLDLGFSGVYLFEGRKRLTEFKPGEGVTYNTSDGLEENLIGMLEPQIDHRDGTDMLTMPITRGDEYIGLAIFRKDQIDTCDIAVIASAMDVTNININKSVRLNRWKRSAYKDPLTGIGNRRFLKEKGNEIAEKCRKIGQPYSMLFIDMDDFGKVNSRYGHGGGDEVLKEIAKKMKANVRPEDVATRYGGEEFVVILPYTGIKDALAAAQNLRQAITIADPLNDGSSFTVSMGAAENRAGESMDDTIQAANRNMYNVKKTLKNATWMPEEKDEQTGLLGVSPLYSSIKRRVGDCNKSVYSGENGKVALMMFNIRGFTKVIRSKGERYASDLLNVVVDSLNGDGPMLDYLEHVRDGPRLARFCDTDRLIGFKYSTEQNSMLASDVKTFMEKILDKVNGSKIKVGDGYISIEVAGSCCIYDPSRLKEDERNEVYEHPEMLLGAIRQVEGKDNTNFSVGLYLPASAQPSQDFVDPQQDLPSL